MSKGLEISFEEDFFKENEDDKEEDMIITGRKNIYEKAEELHSFLKTYFDDTKEDLTKSNSYFSYIFQVPQMFSSCFMTNPCLIKDWNERELMHKDIKTAEICLKILLSYLECPQTVDVTKAIIQTSVSVLHQAYNHCKVSETFYGEFFEEFTNELGSFYKNIQEVQKVTLERLDILLINDSYNNKDESKVIILVSRGIGQLCELLSTLDQNIALIFWKVFSKLMLKYKDVVLENIEVDVFLLPLVLNIEEIVSHFIDSIKSNENIIESEIKLCIMELSLLKKIMLVFSGHVKEESIIIHLRNLSLHLFNLLLLSYSYSTTESKDLNVIRILLKTIKHALRPFFSDSMFFTSALNSTTKDVSPDLQVPLILLKLAALDCLKIYPEQFSLLQKNVFLIEIFSTLNQNTSDDDLKLVYLKIPTALMTDSSNETDLVTLYQHCYTCLVEYTKLFLNHSDSSFLFDKHLLCIFSSSSDVVSLLMSDVWMYYLRSISINDVYKHCTSLAKFLNEEQDSRIERFLIRILKLLPDDFKIRLFEENANMNNLLSIGRIAYTFDLTQMKKLSPTDICSESIIPVIQDLNDPVASDLQKMIQKTCSILELCTLCFEYLSIDELLKFTEFALIVSKSDIFEISLAVVSFLKAFNGRTLPRNNKELDSLTSAIAQLLSVVMQSKNYIIRFEAFNLYIRLAKSTPHPEIVKKTVIKCPALVSSIKSYAEMIPSNGFIKEGIRYEMLQKQLADCHLDNAFKDNFSDESKNILSDLFT